MQKEEVILPCAIVEDLLPGYVDDVLRDESKKMVEVHLENCESCMGICNEMKSGVFSKERMEGELQKQNEVEIKPFKKLRRKVICTMAGFVCAVGILVGLWVWLFGFGWMVEKEDVKLTYSNGEGVMTIDFEIPDNRCIFLQIEYAEKVLIFNIRESFISKIDDRGEEPNCYSYGIGYIQEGDNIRVSLVETVVLRYKNGETVLSMEELIALCGMELNYVGSNITPEILELEDGTWIKVIECKDGTQQMEVIDYLKEAEVAYKGRNLAVYVKEVDVTEANLIFGANQVTIE